MFTKNALQKYLAPIVKKLTDSQRVELATAFGNTPDYMHLLLAGKAWFSTKEAIAFAKITSTDPAVLLNAQTNAQLAAEGVSRAAADATQAAESAPRGTPPTGSTETGQQKAVKAAKGANPARGCARRPVLRNTGSSW